MTLSHTKVSDWQVLYKVRPPLNLEIQVKPPACVPNLLYSCPHVQLYPNTLKKKKKKKLCSVEIVKKIFKRII